jgi:hypothetical protein
VDGANLLARLRTAGSTMACDDDQIIVAPRDRLTDDLRAEIRNAKLELLEALTSERSKQSVPSMPDLLVRIRVMAKRWGFSPEELTEELNRRPAKRRHKVWLDVPPRPRCKQR